MKRFVVRHELVFFFLLTYLLSWWTVPFTKGSMIPYGPSIAAVMIIAMTAGKQGLRGFWDRLTQWRAGWWYLIGPGIILANLLVALVINLLLGATMTHLPYLPSAATLLTLLLLGGVWEEPGFAGYAFPRLRERFVLHKYPDLVSAILLGVLWGFWHVPLYVYGILPWYDFFVVVAFRLIWSWTYNVTSQSVPAVMLSHYSLNVLAGYTMFLVFTGADKTSFYILYVICAWVTALLIAWKTRFKLGASSETRWNEAVSVIPADG